MGDAAKPDIIQVETLIVGSGPLGCTFARKLVDSGHSVFMIDAGDQLSPRPGWNLRNSYMYQRNIKLFRGVVDSHLHTISVPADNSRGFVSAGQNPDQIASYNIPLAAVTYAVGGMATHWNGNIPRAHPGIERSSLLTNQEWDELYDESEMLLNKSQTDLCLKSIRNAIVRETLQKAYLELSPPYNPQNLPVAGERTKETHEFLTLTGADTVLGDHLIKMIETADERLTLKPMWQCIKLDIGKSGNQIEFAIVKDLMAGKVYHIHAKLFVVAAGAILTPQILFNSGIRPQALGHYLCIQPFAGSQVVLLQRIVDAIPNDPRWKIQVEEYQKKHPCDPIPIPPDDPVPQCWIPVSENRPWHCQVCCDISYGPVTTNVDERLVVDLDWFARVEPRFENYVTFSDEFKDMYDMPQPTFHFQTTKEEQENCREMMDDMCKAAKALGSFLPGSEPHLWESGASRHTTGTCRMGQQPENSVVDTYSRVWQFSNLYLGSCGIIPTGTACNPTNTAVALAVRACKKIIEEFEAGKS